MPGQLNYLPDWHCPLVFLFLDTEFSSLEHPELLSLGVAASSGTEFYVERTDFPLESCSPFARTEVLPRFGNSWSEQARLDDVPARLDEWLAPWQDQHLVVAHDYADDLRLLMAALPAHWQRRVAPIDVRWDMSDAAFEEYFSRPGASRHHALHDARALRHSCRSWMNRMRQDFESVQQSMVGQPRAARLAFFRSRWPELGGIHPLQAANEGLLTAVVALARSLPENR